MANDGEFVNLIQEDERIFENLRERIAGMEEEADQLRRLHENVENEIQQLEGKINDTLEKVEEAERFVDNAAASDKFRENRRKGMDPDEDDWYSGDIEDFEREDKDVKNFIQEFAKKAREIEQETEEIRQMIDDAEDKVKEEARELENLGQADAALGKIERKLEQLNSRLPNWDNPDV